MDESNRQAGKRLVSVAVDADLLTRAEAMGVSLSAVVEEALADVVIRNERENWAEGIAQACLVHETYLRTYGSLGEAVRAAAKDGYEPVLA